MKITRKYYRLDCAAKELAVSSDDLIHLAANSIARLHILLPSSARVTPIWYREDDIFGEENLCPVSGFDVDEPVELGEKVWKAYEADPRSAAIDHLSAQNFKDSEFQKTPKGVVFGGWDLLDEEWNRCSFKIADCSIVVMQSEFLQIGRGEQQPAKISDNTLLSTIAALLASWPGGKWPSGKDLERAAASVGIAVSDDSIRKAFKKTIELAPSLQKHA